MRTRLFCLVGPTAVGKTEIAASILEPLGGTIISADARQVYKLMEIGTNKPGPELRARVAFALLDLVPPEQTFSAADFAREARAAIRELQAQDKPFMLVGGSGLYLKALFSPFFDMPRPGEAVRAGLAQMPLAALYTELQAVDPASAARIHPRDRQRIIRALEVFDATGKTITQLRTEQSRDAEFEPVYVGLDLPRPLLRQRIDERFDRMVEQGLVAETDRLLKMGYDAHTPALDAIGYREVIEFLHGRLTREAAFDSARKRSRDYAKRQLTWFRHQPGMVWVDATEPESARRRVQERFERFRAELTDQAPIAKHQ